MLLAVVCVSVCVLNPPVPGEYILTLFVKMISLSPRASLPAREL